MRLNYLAYTFSLAMMYFSIVLIVPILVALVFQETNAILPFLVAAATPLLLATTLRKIVSGTAQIQITVEGTTYTKLFRF